MSDSTKDRKPTIREGEAPAEPCAGDLSGSAGASPSPAPSQPVVIRENIDSLSASLSDQIEMLAGELRTRWKSGKRIGVEQLGSAFEQLAKNEEQLLDLIYHEG